MIGARWRIAYNGFVRGSPWRRLTYLVVAAALGFLTLAGLAGAFVMTMATVAFSQQASSADVVVATGFTSGLVLSVLVSFTVALASLYLSADLDMLLAAPVPRRAVFFSKLVGGLVPSNLLVLVLTLIPLAGYGLGMAQHPLTRELFPARAYVVWSALALGALPLLPAALGALAVMTIVRRVPAHRLGEIVGLVVVAMTLTIALVAGSARQLQRATTFQDLVGILERVRSPWSPAEWLARSVLAASRGELAAAAGWLGLYAGLAVALLVLVAALADRVYYEGWLNMAAADSGRKASRPRLPWNRVDRADHLSRPSGVLSRFPGQVAALVEKDARIIPRDLTNMAQVLSPLSIGIFFVLQQLLYPIRIGGADRPQTFTAPAFAMLSAAIAGGISATIMSRFGLTAFSIENRAYWVIKSAPVSRRRLLFAKFLVGYLPYLALASVLVLVLDTARAVSDARLQAAPMLPSILAAFDIPLLLYALFVVAVVGAGSQAITLALGTARPNMNWDTPGEMLTPDIGCLSLVLYGLYGFVAVSSLAAPAAVSRFPMLGSSTLAWIIGIATGLAATAVAVVGGYLVAEGELDKVGT